MLVELVRHIARSTLRSEWEQLRARIQKECELIGSRPDMTPSAIAQRLLVSAEDHRHGRHPGFDVRAILRAIWRRITSGRREGASTIEQQIVRVLTGRYERSFARKIREILLASLVAESFPKAVHPALYLRIGYFGWRMNSFNQACRRLGLSPTLLSLNDAAALVARLKYPEPHLPSERRLKQIHRRRDHLKELYSRHLGDETYDHIATTSASDALRDGVGAVITRGAVPAT